MPIFRHLAITCLALCLLGCSSQPPRLAWTQERGGLLHDHRQARLSDLGGRVAADLALLCRYYVLNSTQACAYAWADGSIYVSRSLMDALDDDELIAVVAHELGHLLADRHVTPPAGLRGRHGFADAEQAADAVAVQILQRIDVRPGALASALRRVAASDGLSADTRRAIEERVTILTNEPSR